MHAWHTVNKNDLFKLLETNEHGLQKQEAAKRLAEYGANELLFDVQSFWKKLIEPFTNLFAVVLLSVAVISFFSHETLSTIIIVAVLTINAIISWAQQYMTSRVLRALKQKAEQQVTVIRGGAQVVVSIRALVPGDIMLLAEGQQVPADVRVLHDDNVQVDESALTGESLPLEKQAGIVPEDTPLYQRHNMMFRGTYVTSGTAVVLVVETGMQTEFGAIAHLAAGREVKSPVQQKIDKAISILIRVTGVVAALVFMLALIRGVQVSEALTFAMAVGVSMVPEGLPIALTVTIVFGMRRMARKKALVRTFRAIEDIGLLTTIATDKTGTLTKNKLSVVDTWQMSISEPVLSALAHAIGDTTMVSDPLDKAFVQYVHKKKHKPAGLLLRTYPFEQAFRMSAAAWGTQKGAAKKVVFIKGAPEHILRQSILTATERHEAESKLHHFATEGYRVIAIATLDTKSLPEKLENIASHKFRFAGFVACADELRPEAKSAIAQAQKAGIKVRLITGDHYETAFNIAHTLNIATSRSEVISGAELPTDDDALAELVQTKTVFARVLPNDKFRILTALQKYDIAAMTGDGVNDVPALTNAHVGIAMGSGSDIAKDASDMVLLDNNFATTIKGVSEGRTVYNNIRRMMFYLLSTTFGEVTTMIAALSIGLPLPLTAVMILWVNMATDTALVIPLGLEPPEGDEMKSPPRHPNEPILTPAYIVRIFLVGITMAATTLGTFAYFLNTGYSELYASSIAFTVIIVIQWANALNARSERGSVFSRLRVFNDKMAIGLAIAFIMQMLVMFGPLGSLFNIQDVAIAHLIIPVISSAAAVIFVVEIHKLIIRRMHA